MPHHEPHDRIDDARRRSLALLRACASEHGFLASPTDRHNYRRVWARDGAVTGLAALLSGEDDLIEANRRTLRTLARHQGPHGEIPSNVDPVAERVSYGGTAGRVDAGLWFAIVAVEHWRRSGDDAFLEELERPLERLRHLLGAWEFNARGLLYVPATGDWADEYVHSGYVLYDQLLYLQAQRGFAEVHRHVHGSEDHFLLERIAHLRRLIRANYWFDEGRAPPAEGETYHPVLYEKGRDASRHRTGRYWLPFFSPLGYGTRFDTFANALAALFGVADEEQARAAFDHVENRVVQPHVRLLPAFDPVITPQDAYWEELQASFSNEFKNEPHRYHNGGLWPLVTGFHAAALAARGRTDLARAYRDGVFAANARTVDGSPWSFPEYLHGRTHEPEGTAPLAWSAAAGLIADAYLRGERLFASG